MPDEAGPPDGGGGQAGLLRRARARRGRRGTKRKGEHQTRDEKEARQPTTDGLLW